MSAAASLSSSSSSLMNSFAGSDEDVSDGKLMWRLSALRKDSAEPITTTTSTTTPDVPPLDVHDDSHVRHSREMTTYHLRNGHSNGDTSAGNFEDQDLTTPPPSSPRRRQRSHHRRVKALDGFDDEFVDDDGDDFSDAIRVMDARQRVRRRLCLALYWTGACCSVLFCLVGVGAWVAVFTGHLFLAPPPTSNTANAQWQLLAQVFRNDSNSSVDPCVDFYEYVCGNMLARTVLASDETSAGLFHDLRDAVQQRLLQVAEAGWPVVTSWFDACEDMRTRDLYSDSYLSAALARIDTANTSASLLHALASMHVLGAHAVFEFSATVDPLNHTRYMYWLAPVDLSLPRDMMLGNDTLSRQAQQATARYVGELFQLAGYDSTDAAVVLALERQFATFMQPSEAYRASDASSETTLGELSSGQAPFDWLTYYGALAMQALDVYIMDNATQTVHMDGGGQSSSSPSSPTIVDRSAVLALPVLVLDRDAVTAITMMWMRIDSAAQRAYLRYRLLSTLAGDASSVYMAVRNRFLAALNGLDDTSPPPPLWSQCISSATAALGDLFAHYYVQQFFSDRNRVAAEALVTNVEMAMAARLATNRWMDEPTRQAALIKLHAIHAMVGSPDQWTPDVGFEVYSSEEGGVHVQNVLAWRRAVLQSTLAVVLYAVAPQRYPWLMESFDVNAYYSETSNDIVLPAGILQGYFFDVDAPLSINYGALGTVIGHELTHGFDDQGRLYDANGDLREWWTPQSSAEFERRAQCVVDLYSSFEGVDDMPTTHVNGALTLGENLADMGGVHVAYDALQNALEELMPDERQQYEHDLQQVFHATPEQLLFHAYAHVWCTKERVESAYAALNSDPHAPPRWRVNGPLYQMDEFARAYHCAAVSAADTCQVW